jgi:hypothetical protein
MLFIAVGFVVALVVADFLELSRRGAERGSGLVSRR